MPCCQPYEIGIINFDGTGRRRLARANFLCCGGGFVTTLAPMQMNADGSRLIMGGLLFATGVEDALEKGGVLQLAAQGLPAHGVRTEILRDDLSLATMDYRGARILYVFADAEGIRQLATLDFDPGSVGPAPGITEARVTPPSFLTNGRKATVSARVTASAAPILVNSVTLLGGLKELSGPGGVLYDDGTSGGDLTAGDAIFSNNDLAASGSAPIGPRTFRINATYRAGDGRQYATAVDIEPVEVAAP
jgi:hypothetical protein